MPTRLQTTFVRYTTLNSTPRNDQFMIEPVDDLINTWVARNVEPGTNVTRMLSTVVCERGMRDTTAPVLITTLVIEYTPKTKATE